MNSRKSSLACVVRFWWWIFLIFVETTTFAGKLSPVAVQPPPGIVAWWSLDETTGSISADRIGQSPAAWVNSPTPEPGEVRGALRFNGSNYITAQDSAVWNLAGNDFTVELWANWDQTPGGSVGEPAAILIGNDEGPGSRAKWFFGVGGGEIYFHINGPSLGPQFFPLVPFSPTVGKWYHLAVVRKGSTYTIYINGVASGSATNANVIPDANAPLTIGQGEGIGFVQGLLDEVTLYNRALTSTEILGIYNAGTAGKVVNFAVQPSGGGNSGSVTILINGSNFVPGATVGLTMTGQKTITAANALVGGSGSTVTATFNLTGAKTGAWNVVVTNPDGTTASLPAGFTVQQTGGPQIWVTNVGFGLIRPGRGQVYNVIYGNNGTVDSMGAIVTVAVPKTWAVTVGNGQPLIGTFSRAAETILTFAVSPIPAGGSGVLQFMATPPVDPAILGKQYGLRTRFLPFESPVFALSSNKTTVANAQAPAITSTSPNLTLLRGLFFGEPALLDGDTFPPNLPASCPACDDALQDFLNAVKNAQRASAAYQAAKQAWSAQWTAIGWEIAEGATLALAITAATPFMMAALGVEGVPVATAVLLEGTIASFITSMHDVTLGNLTSDPDAFRSAIFNAQNSEAAVGIQYKAVLKAATPKQATAVKNSLDSFLGPFNFLVGIIQSLINNFDNLENAKKQMDQDKDLFDRANVQLPSLLQTFLNCTEANCAGGESSTPTDPEPNDPGADNAALLIAIIASFDPNDITGPAGIGPSRYITDQTPLAYSVSFENDPSASAPAQQVTVTDQLDRTTMDLRTFSFGPISFGDVVAIPPPHQSTYTTQVDLRPATDLLVGISAALNVYSGVVTWQFTSLDPATGQPTADPSLGFLPPDTNPPGGEGSVLFTISPQKGLNQGTLVSNSANIVFDANPPLATGVWTNTIATAPANVTTSVKVTPGGFIYNRGTRQFTQQVTLTNNGTTPIAEPIYVVLDNLSANATLANQDGTVGLLTPLGSSFKATGRNGMALGPKNSLTFTLNFADPSLGGISYTPRILAGAGTP